MTIYLPDAPLVPATKIPDAETVWGPFPVGEWDSVIVSLQGPAAAADALHAVLSWDDLPGITTDLWCGSNSARLFGQVRNVGAQLRVTFTNPDTAAYVASIATTQRPMTSPGPRMPASVGEVIVAGTTGPLNQFASADRQLWGTGGSQLFDGYCGPATLYVRGLSAAAATCIAMLLDTTGATGTVNQALGAASCAVTPGSSGLATIVVPPFPCTLRMQNSAANVQPIDYALVAA